MDTVEEKIIQLQRRKKQLANMTVAGDEKWIGELSDRDLKQLISLGE